MKTKQSMKTTATSPGKPQKEEADSPAGGYRKGPWTEQEDMKLVWFVRLFGERRWDFLAKVSGKSCRLRWVNYLHPDLKRGRMSPDEERLVVELHAKWGNRWSRIAMSMPGRTDNEIKNYWRTHMRKQDKTQRAAASGSGSAPASASTITTTTTASPATSSSSSSSNNNDKQSKDGDEEKAATAASQVQEDQLLCSGAMDHLLWNDVIDPFAWNSGPGATCVGAGSSMMVVPSSPVWDYCCSDSLWRLGDDEVAEHKKTLGTTVFVQPTRDYSMCT